MASSSVVNAQQRLVLEEIRRICEEIDPEAASHLNRYMPDRIMPNPVKRPAEHGLFIAECLLILAKAVKRRRGGRPKNVTWHSEAGDDAEQAS